MARGDSARKRDGQAIAYVLPNSDPNISVAVGVNDVFGAKTVIQPKDADYKHVYLQKLSVDIAAVVTETVTVDLIATDELGNTKTVTKTTTANTEIEYDAQDLADLHTTLKQITKYEVQAKTSDAAAGPTVTLESYALEFP